jgi:hypothetical protein
VSETTKIEKKLPATHRLTEQFQIDCAGAAPSRLKLEDSFERVIRILIDRHPHICCWQVESNLLAYRFYPLS